MEPMRESKCRSGGLGPGAVLALVLLVGAPLGCSQRATGGSATGAGASAVGAGGAGAAGGHGGSSGAPAGGGGTGGQGGGTSVDGGAAGGDAGAEMCTNGMGWTHRKPTGYDLPHYDGGTDGLCDPVDSIGCNTSDIVAAEEVVCTPSHDACCFAGELFEPEPCGWVGCSFGDDAPAGEPGKCENELAKTTLATQSPVCNFCASDADCKGSTFCNIRLGDRMICGPK